MGLDVLKELPGYKPILKAVLKEQIQLLVEQLSEHTGEETVVLSANVTDGTLSYLGTESGKIFLEEEHVIKSKFLGFCLKRTAWVSSDAKPSDHGDQYYDAQSPVLPAKRLRIPSVTDQWSPGPVSRSSPQSSNIPTATHVTKSSFLPGGSSTQRVARQEIRQRGHIEGSFLSQSEDTHAVSNDSSRWFPNREHGQSFTEEEHRGETSTGQERFSSLQDNSTSETSPRPHKVDSHQQVVNLMNNQTNVKDHLQKTNMDIDEFSRLYDVQLSKHLRTFKCSFCDKNFREKTNLRVHERVHTGEKPFTCRVCRKSFAHSSNLKQHERAVHKIAPSIPIYKQQFYSDIGASYDDSQVSGFNDSNSSNFHGSNNSYLNDPNNSYFDGSNAGQTIVKQEPQDDCEIYDLDPSGHGNSQSSDSFALQNRENEANISSFINDPNSGQTLVKREPVIDSPVYDLDPSGI